MANSTPDPLHWGAPAPDILRGLAEIQSELAHTRKLPPVDSWNPAYCGDLDIRIGTDGTWYYLGTPIGRPGLVRLFSTILRRDEDGRYYLITPVEKVGIRVDDAPFLAVRVDQIQDDGVKNLMFTTNVGDQFVASAEHPLRVEFNGPRRDPRPYVLVRGRLEALVSRAVYYELVGLAEERMGPGGRELVVASGSAHFPLGFLET